MKIGIGVPQSGSWATPERQARYVARAEELGYATAWTFQRLLFPPDPGSWSPVYRSVLDPMVSLGYVAARTSRIRLGVALLNMPFMSPALLAKQATTVDVLSGGRLDLGLGLGWRHEEFAASGVPIARRGARADEYIAVLKTLWGEEVAEFQGEFYEIPASRQEPHPVQSPHPPLILGAKSAPALRRAGRLGDGWVSSSNQDLTEVAADIETVRTAARDAGRDPAALRFVCRGVVRAGEPVMSHGERRRLTGTYDQIRADLAWLGEQGMTEVFVDANFIPEIGNADADPDTATAKAEEIMTELAPR
ncbi:MAG TPA: TIGR03619 family F420-dependent LLM class oxidoreductase [Streptosporangiaceae bacterium]|jgi:probable F420-dependent oxidoreductase